MDHDEIPLEQRRELWGWFGEPWPSGICYGEDGRIDWGMRKQTPVGEPCAWCVIPFGPEDQGVAIPHLDADRHQTIRHTHKECMLRQVVGPLAHLQSDCPGDGSCFHQESALSPREDALAVWEWVRTRAPI